MQFKSISMRKLQLKQVPSNMRVTLHVCGMKCMSCMGISKVCGCFRLWLWLHVCLCAYVRSECVFPRVYVNGTLCICVWVWERQWSCVSVYVSKCLSASVTNQNWGKVFMCACWYMFVVVWWIKCSWECRECAKQNSSTLSLHQLKRPFPNDVLMPIDINFKSRTSSKLFRFAVFSEFGLELKFLMDTGA